MHPIPELAEEMAGQPCGLAPPFNWSTARMETQWGHPQGLMGEVWMPRCKDSMNVSKVNAFFPWVSSRSRTPVFWMLTLIKGRVG